MSLSLPVWEVGTSPVFMTIYLLLWWHLGESLGQGVHHLSFKLRRAFHRLLKCPLEKKTAVPYSRETWQTPPYQRDEAGFISVGRRGHLPLIRAMRRAVYLALRKARDEASSGVAVRNTWPLLFKAVMGRLGSVGGRGCWGDSMGNADSREGRLHWWETHRSQLEPGIS